jgi:phosphoribosylformylglycinamidine synthase
LGFHISCDKNIRKDAFLFGEAQSRVLVTVKKDQAAAFESFVKSKALPCTLLGEVKGDALVIDGHDYGKVSMFQQKFDTSIESYMS